MSVIRILIQTEDTVTISREDWLKVLADLEDAEDAAAVAERRVRERLLGKASVRRDYLTAAEAVRLLDGENPVKVWRAKRGLSQRALAAQAKIGSSYLAEIESGRKPGSNDAVRRLAAALGASFEDLDPRQSRMRQPYRGPVVLRLSSVSAGVGAGGRGAWAPDMPLPTLDAALDFVRDEWPSLRSRSPYITDNNGSVIYTSEELVRELEG
jgi:DNA-binding XRE family transcriptional regulator